MALKSFKIENIKAVVRAECNAVPRVMIIAGPNGVGKSTLLYELNQRRGTVFPDKTTVLYQPPHRAIRASSVRRRNTFGGATTSYFDQLSRPEVSAYEGMNIQMPARTPDNVDEAGSTIKHSFAKLENRFQTAVTERVVREKQAAATQFDLTAIPDIYEPLRHFTEFLLPHLRFHKIDLSTDDDIKCLWTRKDRHAEITLDIDKLSSGEKAMIMMFLPTIESQITARLDTIDPPQTPAVSTDTLVIIDEPEQHLHPDLQARVLSYLRKVSTTQNTQFIVSTHSPTILDQAWDDELYVMTAASDDAADNQLKRVATNLERLEALRDLTGNTFALTTGRSIICIEGHNTDISEPSDIRILELICPRATAYTFVPVGNKASVVNTVQQLRTNLPASVFKVEVFGLTDNDRGGALPVGVMPLPACMIENLLLVPSALLTTSGALKGTAVTTDQEMETLIESVVIAQRENEISLRVSKQLKAKTVRPKGADLETVRKGISDDIAEFSALLDAPASIQKAIDDATQEVERIMSTGEALRVFRGKPLLRSLFNRLFPEGTVAFSVFVHTLAAQVAAVPEAQEQINNLLDNLERSVARPTDTEQSASASPGLATLATS